MTFKRLDYLARTVLSRMDVDELAGSEPMRASNEGGTRPTGEETADRMHPQREETPRIERDVVKAPSRSRDGWTVRKPPKRTGATDAPASDLRQTERITALIQKLDGEPSPARGRPVLRVINGKCLLMHPKRARPTPGISRHLRLVWSADHARSFSGVRA